MGQSFKAKVLKRLIGARAFLIAAGAILLAIVSFGFSQRRYGKKIGAAKQGAKDSRKRAEEALASGDDDAVLAEWRRSRKK